MLPIFFDLGRTIRNRREFLNLRQEDVAEISGVAIKTIHSIEKGTGNPSIGTLRKILTVLGMELSVRIKNVD